MEETGGKNNTCYVLGWLALDGGGISLQGGGRNWGGGAPPPRAAASGVVARVFCLLSRDMYFASVA